MKWGSGWPRKLSWGSNATIKQWKNIEDMADKASKALENGKTEITITNPSSMRSFTRGDDDTFISGNVAIGSEENADKKLDVVSSAINKVRYDAENQKAYITYQGGNKEYEFDVSEDELDAFLRAPSKGRHVQHIWKKENRAAGY